MTTRIANLLRALPLATLGAVVAASVIVRMQRGGDRLRDSSTSTKTVMVWSNGASASGSGSVARLTAPPLPPDAAVPEGGPRTLHGSAKRTHRSAARGPRTIKVGWKVVADPGEPSKGSSDAGAPASRPQPVAAQVTTSADEQTLYAATLGGQLVALARADGARRWAVSLGERGYGAPLVHEDGTVYVGSDAKKLFAISPAGNVLFRLDVEGEADSAPAFGKDGTILFAAGNQLHAARRGGDLAWRFTARSKIYTAPAVTDDGLVIVGSQDDHVYAIGAAGALVWSTDLGADVDGSPTIGDDGSIYVGTDAGDVVRLDPKGHLAWRTPVGGFVRGSLSIARNGDVLAGTYGPTPRVVRIAPDGALRGSFAIRGTGAKDFGIHGGPLEDADGVLYFGAQDDAVYAIEPDGALRFRYETGADCDAPLTLLSDGSLVVPSEDGSVTLLLP